jgi:hypothetical protein
MFSNVLKRFQIKPKSERQNRPETIKRGWQPWVESRNLKCTTITTISHFCFLSKEEKKLREKGIHFQNCIF